MEVHELFIDVMKRHLDEAVAAGAIEPIDTELAGRAWFGAVSEVLTHWLLAEHPAPIEDTYSALRPMIFRSVGAKEDGR